MEIGQKIKEFRERLGFTQQQLGYIVHVSESAIGNYENGKRNPSIELLKQIADALKVKIGEFFEEEKKTLLQFPMTYKEFRMWGNKMQEREGWGWFTEDKFEYAMKSDRYFVELKKDYLIWLKDGFYLVPIESQYVDSEYNDVVQIEETRKVLKKDLPYIEREVKRKPLITYNEKLFAEQVYVSKYDFQTKETTDYRDFDNMQWATITSDQILAYIEKTQSCYVYAPKGILRIPITEETFEYYKEEGIELPYGIYEEEEVSLDNEKAELLDEIKLKELQEFMLEEKYLIKRLFGLLKKEVGTEIKEKHLIFKKIEEELSELENEEFFHEKDKDVIAQFLRFRIWSYDNLKRILQKTVQKDDSIFEEEWEKEKEIEFEINEERAEHTREYNTKKNEKLKELFPKRYKIMVADDGVFMRAIITNSLENNIYCETYTADNGQEAIDLYKWHYEKGSPFDLILMDIAMPGVDGIEATKKIKQIDPNALILMCSSLVSEKTVVNCIRAGANHFVSKPFNEEDSIPHIINQLKQHQK